MTATLLPWVELLICATLIGLVGPVLTQYGDSIARLTGLSRSWIGLVLLATATSLPELITGVSSSSSWRCCSGRKRACAAPSAG